MYAYGDECSMLVHTCGRVHVHAYRSESRVHACMHWHTCMKTYNASARALTCACVCLYIYACICTCVYVCVYMRMCIFIRVYAHVYM
jgi:hypothetical protein